MNISIDFEIVETVRLLTWSLKSDGGRIAGEVIAIELPLEIHIKDRDHDLCPDDEDHECNLVEILNLSQQLYDPVYSCGKCGEGDYLIAFPGEPAMLLGHIEKCLKVEKQEIIEGLKTIIRFSVPAA